MTTEQHIKDGESNKPMVSICCLTYNHSAYVEETLQGFLNQRTNFDVEIVIHDDASDDGTQAIINSFANKHPDKFKVLLQKTNQRSKFKSGMNPRFNFPRAKGKYIALCEGDDYWTDPDKLTKQVAFLESNPNVDVCFTRTNLLRDGELSLHQVPEADNGEYSFNDLLEHGNFIATASVMFRNLFPKLPDWFEGLPFGDMAVYLLLGNQLNIKCLPDITAVYRIHNQGAWHQHNQKEKIKSRLVFNQIIYAQLTEPQQNILSTKQIHWMNTLANLQSKKLGVLKKVLLKQYNTKYGLTQGK